MDQTTIAGDGSLADGDADRQWALTIVHHRQVDRLGDSCRVSGKVLLGRESGTLGDGVFDDGRVSRRHAEVEETPGGLTIADLASRNGTYVNGERVARRALAEGDVIGLGTLMLLCHRVPDDFAPIADEYLDGIGPAHAALVAAIAAVADRPTPVLVRGETGSGRDRVATSIHRRSGRAGAFVPVHCGALSAGRPRDELFGDGDDHGLVGRAAGGTLYLDGIDDASPELQMSLLRFLESDDQRKVRIVASARENLDDRVAAGKVRQDFAARLGRFTIDLPPLRERVEDIPVLAAAFIRKFAEQPTPPSTKLALRLLRHRWPGNIRELESVIERAVIEAGDAERLPLSQALDDLLQSSATAAPSGDTPFELSSREQPPAQLRVAGDGRWFEIPGSDRVDLENRRALPLLLAALVQARDGGRPLSVSDLIERGWPGERILEEAGANRVYVGLTTLRKLGLRDFIVRTRDGYCIDPDVAMDVA